MLGGVGFLGVISFGFGIFDKFENLNKVGEFEDKLDYILILVLVLVLLLMLMVEVNEVDFMLEDLGVLLFFNFDSGLLVEIFGMGLGGGVVG